MEGIYTSITDIIGNTPLLELKKYEELLGLKGKLIAKLEFLNPGGSVKDRIAKAMIEDAEKCGILKKGSTIIEPTSGNTGIGLAVVAAARGYRVVIVMPETMSIERRNLLEAYGAKLVLTPGHEGMKGSINKAKKLAEEIPDSFLTSQFTNPVNPECHKITTGPEIWRDTHGNVDVFVAGIGTGGTISGVGEYLRSQDPQIEIIGVEPAESPVLSTGKAGPHRIQGIGAGFVPDTLNTEIYSRIITVSGPDAYSTTKAIARTEGFLVGISSGAAVYAAAQLAKEKKYSGKNIVVLLPDGGERYISTKVFVGD